MGYAAQWEVPDANCCPRNAPEGMPVLGCLYLGTSCVPGILTFSSENLQPKFSMETLQEQGHRQQNVCARLRHIVESPGRPMGLSAYIHSRHAALNGRKGCGLAS